MHRKVITVLPNRTKCRSLPCNTRKTREEKTGSVCHFEQESFAQQSEWRADAPAREEALHVYVSHGMSRDKGFSEEPGDEPLRQIVPFKKEKWFQSHRCQ